MIILCAILAVFCLLYYILIISYAGAGSAFVSFWFLAFIGFTALSALFYANKRLSIFEKTPKPLIITVSAVILAGVLLFTFLFGCVISGMLSKPENDAEYVIVLGAQIRGDIITKSLKKRLDAAYDYYMENSDRNITIIVSGGQGEGENTSEAYAMKAYLTDRGIPAGDIIMEEKSTTTNENLMFSYKIICDNGDSDAGIIICSNNFHIFRAVRLARHIGIKNAEGLAAGSDGILLLNYMVRDSLAIFKEFLLGNI